MRSRSALLLVTVATALLFSFATWSIPAGADGATSATAVTDNAAGVVTGGSFTFTAAVTGSLATPTGTDRLVGDGSELQPGGLQYQHDDAGR